MHGEKARKSAILLQTPHFTLLRPAQLFPSFKRILGSFKLLHKTIYISLWCHVQVIQLRTTEHDAAFAVCVRQKLYFGDLNLLFVEHL